MAVFRGCNIYIFPMPPFPKLNYPATITEQRTRSSNGQSTDRGCAGCDDRFDLCLMPIPAQAVNNILYILQVKFKNQFWYEY